MKLRTILKIVAITVVMLLCTGLATSLYLKMSIKERAEYFDLYTLVPPDTKLVVDTDNIVDLMKRINELSCSRDNHILHFSRFFSDLKEHINYLLDQSPHGLSKQMSKMLISFHEPEDDQNQVFYYRLSDGDYEFIENLIQRYSSAAFSPRFFDYLGEKICIYPMPDDMFLACYVNSRFLVLSYQKKLIERVIDTYLSKESILSDETFSKLRSEHRMVAPATIYIRMQSVEMGRQDSVSVYSPIGNWAEFNANLNRDVIYLSGVSYNTDSCHTFMDAIHKQKPISDCHENIFPASTFFFSEYSISDPEAILGMASTDNTIRANDSNTAAESDNALLSLLKEQDGSAVSVCMFHSNDTSSKTPYAVASIPLNPRSPNISQTLKSLCRSVSQSGHYCVLPHNRMLAQLTGITDPSSNTYLFPYRNRLLIASDVASIQTYIACIEDDHALLEESQAYEDFISLLSQSYHFLMMADVSQMLKQPENNTRFIPNLFFRYGNFFSHFIFTVQLTCDDDAVYPNLILTYKETGSGE